MALAMVKSNPTIEKERGSVNKHAAMCFDKWVIKHETYYYALREIIIYGRVIISSPIAVDLILKERGYQRSDANITPEEIQSFHVSNFRVDSIHLSNTLLIWDRWYTCFIIDKIYYLSC